MSDRPAITEETKAALHEAGHFVLCWLFGLPMTAYVTAKGTGKTISRRKLRVTPEEMRICLMGGYAAETLARKPDFFLDLTGGIEAARQHPDRADTKKAALLCQTAAEYDTAFIVAHYLLNHYKGQLAETIQLLATRKRITAADARELCDRWNREETAAYYPDKRTIARCLERINQKRARQ